MTQTHEQTVGEAIFAELAAQGFFYRGITKDGKGHQTLRFGRDDGEVMEITYLKTSFAGVRLLACDQHGLPLARARGSSDAAALMQLAVDLTAHRPGTAIGQLGDWLLTAAAMASAMWLDENPHHLRWAKV